MWDEHQEIKIELEKVERQILHGTISRNVLLSEITKDLALAGGKRLRPVFVILSAYYGNYDSQKATLLASALEMLHMATLVHDDVVDKAATRRGLPTVSAKHGIDMAVYTGDFLFTKAVLMLSGNVSAERLDTIAKAVKTICEGEVDQLCQRYDPEISLRAYLRRISRKTAVLFAAACLVGADSGECSPEISKKLARLGFYYGVAFQIKDDLMDFTSSQEIAGKPVMSDLKKGIYTLPVIYALTKNIKLKKILSDHKIRKGIMDHDDFVEVQRLISEAKGIEGSAELLDAYINRGLKIIDSLPENKSKMHFMELFSRLKA